MAEIISLDVKHFSKRGWGVADKLEIFGALPGDQITARKIGRRKGALCSIEKPSPDRIAPKCQHAGTCGGCTFQTMKYSAQLERKMKWVESLHEVPVEPIISCEPHFGHRNKMEYTFSQDKEGNHYLGQHMPNYSGRVVDLQECHLGSPWFANTLNRVREWWKSTDITAYKHYKDTGTLRTLTLREGKRTGAKMVILTISGKARDTIPQKHLRSFADLFDENTSVFLVFQQARKGYPTRFLEMHMKGPDHLAEEMHIDGRVLKFHVSPLSFFQPNTLQAEKLYQLALDIAKPEGHVLDLYAGAATLGVLFAPHTDKVTSVELNTYACLDAEENIRLNGISNLTLEKGDVAKILPTLPPADLTIIDPPRAGLGPAVQHLKTDKILYISCNPDTQACDIKALPDYRVTHLQPVDQFPHTPHLENIALLEKI